LAWLVALTVTEVVEVTLGAMRSPEVEIDPAEVDQVTAVFDVPLTVAVNCWVPPDESVALAGETATDTVPGGFTVTVAEAELAVLAWLVALTVTDVEEVTVGAVKRPELEMDPAEVDQVTAVLGEPLTVAVNCWAPPEETVALPGEISTDPGFVGSTVTLTDADLPASASLVATTVTLIAEAHVGAVKLPEGEIEPELALQETPWLTLPVPTTVAVHCVLWPVWRDVGLQETEIEATAPLELVPAGAAFPGCVTPHDVWIRADIMTTNTM
jgi:hypothetical protein